MFLLTSGRGHHCPIGLGKHNDLTLSSGEAKEMAADSTNLLAMASFNTSSNLGLDCVTSSMTPLRFESFRDRNSSVESRVVVIVTGGGGRD